MGLTYVEASMTHSLAKLHAAGRLHSPGGDPNPDVNPDADADPDSAAAQNPKRGKKNASASAAVGATLAALETAAVRAAGDMQPQGVANTLYAYGKLGRTPRHETWTTMDAAVTRTAPNMVWPARDRHNS